METPALAQQWIESEADNWLAALRSAAAGRRFATVIAVAESMHWFSDRWAHWGHWTEVFALASNAADELGDAPTTATQLNYLSWSLNICDGDCATAISTAERAYRAAESADDGRQQGWARYYQAWAQISAGEPAAALTAAGEASRLLREAGDLDGLSQVLNWIGRGYEGLGQIDDALEVYHQRLALVTDPVNAPSPTVAASTVLSSRTSIARMLIIKGDWGAAVEVLRPVTARAEAEPIPALQALALVVLGEALCETGHRGEGLEHLRTAQALYQRLNNESETARVQALVHKHV
jgi:tetratricopeptide (TPR) repeat protein